jgi:nucleoid-associated protein EbfC
MNPFDLLKNLNIEELKKKSQETLEKIKDMKVTGEAGGGFVKVTINGEFNILSIDYENNDLIKNDTATFRDLIISAHADAVKKMKDDIQNNFSNSLAPGLFQ